MATITKKNVRNQAPFGGVPYGNLTVKPYSMVTNASGVFTDSNGSSAVGIGDVINLGVLPAGITLYDALTLVSDAFTALATADIGFAYVDGVDDSDVPQDANYFGSALALDAQGRLPADNATVIPVKLPKEAYLTVTIAGAALAEAGRLDVLIYGVQ